MDENRRRLVLHLISLCLHLATALIIVETVPRLGLPPYWLRESLGCVALSAVLVLPLFFARRRAVLVSLLVLRMLVFAIVSMPLGASLWIVLGMAFALVLDAGPDLPLPVGTAFGVLTVAMCCARSVAPLRAWNHDVSGRLTAENLFGLVSLVLVLVLARMVCVLRARERENMEIQRQLNDSIRALTSASNGFLSYASGVERSAIENERNRLTREIHDAVGHTLTNIRMMMEAAIRRDWEDGAELRKLHEWIMNQAQRGLVETRSILYLIRSIEEPEITGVREIGNLVRTFMEATHVEVSVDWSNIPWSWQNEYFNKTVFRIVQEGMTNAFRHGHATEIRIYFYQDESALTIRVEDNGRGSGDYVKGIGLSGMEERLRAIDGTVSACGTETGFRLLARLPLAANLAGAGGRDATVAG